MHLEHMFRGIILRIEPFFALLLLQLPFEMSSQVFWGFQENSFSGRFQGRLRGNQVCQNREVERMKLLAFSFKLLKEAPMQESKKALRLQEHHIQQSAVPPYGQIYILRAQHLLSVHLFP